LPVEQYKPCLIFTSYNRNDKSQIIVIMQVNIIVMTSRATPLYPASAKEMEALGQRLRDARLRRRFSMETVCARANLSRPTLYKIETGDPSVAIGFYVQVLRVLGLLADLSLIAKEDALGRRLQDESLPQRKRAPRKKAPTGASDGEA
jgi:transcriptional regulator with XRE-family HTH domain